MSSGDQVRPYHAKEPARGQEAADAVAAVLKHAAEHDEHARKKPPPKKQPRWMLPVGIQLGLIAVYLLISPPRWITVHPIKGPDPAAQERSLRVAMYIQSQQIEAYRQKHGRLPTSLAEMGGSIQPGVQYHRQGSGQYQLTGTNGEAALVYNSTEPAQDFLGSAGAARLRAGNAGSPRSTGG